LSSPYLRGADTARRAVEGSGLDLTVRLDERLRERELGLFDGLTSSGIRQEYPDEAERRRRLGKFYYRPPGGESWVDVALRVRSLLRDLGPDRSGDRLWVFTHQAVISCFRYVLEELTEADVLELDRSVPIPNGSTTAYDRDEDGAPVLRAAADTTAVQSHGAPPTQEPEHAGRGEPR
jgi:broad specificity phosphatase PhoE